MEDFRIPYDVRDALLCLTFLAAMGVTVFVAMSRHKMAWLAVAGLALMAVDPLIELILFRVLSAVTMPVDSNWIYSCVSSLASVIGIALIVAALFLATRPQSAPTAPPM